MTEPREEFGALAAALAKAQAAFPAIQRDKEVVVQKKAGGQYTFKYAPLDTILAATRKPLSDNGLAIVQLLDDGELVTMLLHSSGARLSGRVALPTEVDIQGLGSAITYLRRYSIQAILGIAAEEDDDGNRASGNMTTPRVLTAKDAHPEDKHFSNNDRRPTAVIAETAAASPFQTSEQGVVEFAKSGPADGELRSGPDGSFLVFRFLGADGKAILPQVAAYGPLAEALSFLRQSGGFVGGIEASVSGVVDRVPFGDSNRTFQRLTLARIERLGADGWTLPAPAEVLPAEAVSEPLGLDVEELDSLAETLPWPEGVTTA